MAEELLRAPLNAANHRVRGLGAPAATKDATYTDNTTLPQPAGTASPGSSFLAAPADHVHPAATTDYDAILFADPASPNTSYTPTYGSGLVTAETWTNLSAQTVKTIAYTYSSGRVATEVRKAYDTTAGAVVAQVTFTYTYVAGTLQSYVMTRDLGGTTNPSIDQLLESEPVAADISYVVTFASGKVSNETWRYTSSSLKLKEIVYAYTGNQLDSEVRKVYAPDGVTTIGQITITYTYSSGTLQSTAQTRDV